MSLPLAKYDDILPNLLEGAYLVDQNRVIQLWNPAAERITGHKAADVIGHCCAEGLLQHVTETGTVLCYNGCPLQATIRDGTTRTARVFLRHKRGHRVPVHVRAVPVRDAEGQITGSLEFFSEDLPRYNEQLELLSLQAYRDQLTGLFNRRYMEEALRARLQRKRAFGIAFGIILGDVDHFKKLNDTYGHDTGDEVLKVLAGTLSHSARAGEEVGRWGGEEFLFLLDTPDETSLVGAARRFLGLIQATSHPSVPPDTQVRMSMGATLVRQDDTRDTLLHRADMLLYDAKVQGRNRWVTDAKDQPPCGPEVDQKAAQTTP